MQRSSVQYCTNLTLLNISFFFYLCRPRNTSIWDEDKRQPADYRFPGAVCYKYTSKWLLFSLLHLTLLKALTLRKKDITVKISSTTIMHTNEECNYSIVQSDPWESQNWSDKSRQMSTAHSLILCIKIGNKFFKCLSL